MAQLFLVHLTGIMCILNVMNFRPFSINPYTVIIKYTIFQGTFIVRVLSDWWQEWSSWLRHCATRWAVPGSIPGRVLGNFEVTYSFYLPSVALGFMQPLTEISMGVKHSRLVELASHLLLVKIGWKPNIPNVL
jgi:hypothetical protein